MVQSPARLALIKKGVETVNARRSNCSRSRRGSTTNGDASPVARTNQRRASDSAGQWGRRLGAGREHRVGAGCRLALPTRSVLSKVDSQFPLLHHGLPDAGGQLRARARQTAALGKSPLARAGSAVRAGAGAWVAVHPCTGLPDPHFLPGVPRTLCTGVHSQCRIYRGWASRRIHWGRNSARLACAAVAGAGYGCAACRTLPARECWLAALRTCKLRRCAFNPAGPGARRKRKSSQLCVRLAPQCCEPGSVEWMREWTL